MKKLSVLLAAALLALSLAACGQSPASQASSAPAESASPEAEAPESGAPESAASSAQEGSQASSEAPADPLPEEAALDGSAVTMMELGAAYPYETRCSEDTSLSTVGQAALTRYEVVDTDDAHPGWDGYQWHLLEFTITYSDENAWNYGMQNRVYDLNWYTGLPYEYPDAENDPGLFTMEWQGQEWECQATTNVAEAQWSDDQVFTYRLEIAYQLPQGYDGVALVLFNSAYLGAEGATFDQAIPEIMADSATLCFRVGA